MAAPQGYPYWPPDFPVGVPGSKPYRMDAAGGVIMQQPRPPRTYGSYRYGEICPIVARGAGRAAHRAVERMTRDSRLFRDNQGLGGGSGIALIEPSDLVVGRMLGRGGFSEVHEARLASSYAGEGGIAGGETATKGYRHRYAVKYLRRTVMQDKKKFERGAADLAIEAKLLSAFNHPHIIRLHGITAGSVIENIALGEECSFFLVIDRLYDTLEDRIEAWKNVWNKCSGLLYRATHDLRGYKRRALMMERLRVALDLAEAVRYLHENSVAFRDIKPENVGFDARGILKLFDFGLSKELKPTRRYCDGTYQLTGNTGSRRYMAPEVAKARPYNLSVDSYSFGILLWEMLALEKPFEGYSEAKHMELVVEGGQRPKIDRHGVHSHWPTEAHDLIETCWKANLHERPTFIEIINVLNSCIDDDVSKHGQGARSLKDGSPRIGGAKRVGSFLHLTGEAA